MAGVTVDKIVPNFGRGGLCPTTTAKKRIEATSPDTNVTTAYATMFSYTGSGLWFAEGLRFDSDAVTVKLTVDSDIIYEINLEDAGMDIEECGIRFDIDTEDARLEFCHVCAIPFTSSVKIEAKKNSGVDKTLEQLTVALTKET